ncbi:MAG: sugar phosphate isomerase/epimerase, partial [Spirochaetales bacterium]
ETALPHLRTLDLGAFQPEVYLEETLGEWEAGAQHLGRVARDEGLHTQQFVAHFLMHYFGRDDVLRSNTSKDLMKRVVQLVMTMGGCPSIIVPVPAYEESAEAAANPAGVRDERSRFVERIASLLAIVEDAGLRLGLEALPGSLVHGTQGFLDLAESIESATIGLCLDTGHSWASGEDVTQAPKRLGNRILGTHICDNDGIVNTSGRPGTGTIDWNHMVQAIVDSGYSGSWDIEIGCAPELVNTEYQEGLAFLRRIRAAYSTPARPAR